MAGCETSLSSPQCGRVWQGALLLSLNQNQTLELGHTNFQLAAVALALALAVMEMEMVGDLVSAPSPVTKARRRTRAWVHGHSARRMRRAEL